jgi:hypothetical protein
MNKKFLTGLIVTAAAITGSLAQASAASAQIASNSAVWNGTQPTIFNGASVGFNHQPFQQFVNQERVAIPNSGQTQIDPSRLFLKFNHHVKVSFINEGALYHNQLAFNAQGATNTSSVLFKDVACFGQYDGGQCRLHTNNQAVEDKLKFGDTVKAGLIKGGTQLDFFLRARGVERGANTYTYGTQTASNPDGLNHVVAYTYGGRYVIMGFENQFGTGGSQQGMFRENSDRDFNDTVFVLDVGERNVQCLEAGTCEKAPEPAAALGLIGMSAAAVLKRRFRA